MFPGTGTLLRRGSSMGAAWLALAAPLAAQSALSPIFAEVIEEMSGVFAFPSLRFARLPGNGREIRIWVGFGISAPENVVRIVDGPKGVHGSVLYYWQVAEDSIEEAAADRDPDLISNRELAESLKIQVGCGGLRAASHYQFCEGTLAKGQSWRVLLTTLDSLGIETLPDDNTLVPTVPIGLDGTTMVIEVRRGTQYRAYDYWSPRDDAPQPEVRRASAILDFVGTIGMRRRPGPTQ